jgi:hypothetical protein
MLDQVLIGSIERSRHRTWRRCCCSVFTTPVPDDSARVLRCATRNVSVSGETPGGRHNTTEADFDEKMLANRHDRPTVRSGSAIRGCDADDRCVLAFYRRTPRRPAGLREQ